MIVGLDVERRRRLQIVVLCCVLIIPCLSQATGFRIASQGASGAGQADAFIAQGDDPSAIYYNPAGVTQLPGVQLMMGALMVGGSTHFTNSATGAKSTGDLDGPVSNPPPLHFYLTVNLESVARTLELPVLAKTTVGIGVFSPFGLRTRWPEDGPLNTSLTFASLPLLDVRPVIAYKVSEQLSLAVGADIYTFASFLGEGGAVTKFRSSGASGLPLPGTPLEVNGEDTTPGLNLSLRYSPCLSEGTRPWCSFGFQYRSRATLHLEGEFLEVGTAVTSVRTRLTLPQSFTFGVAVWPLLTGSHEWKVEVDLDKTDWSAFRHTNVHLGTGSVLQVPRNWKNTLTYMVGTEYTWLDPLALPHWNVAARAGWQHSATPIPSRTFDPGIPDSDKHVLSVGMGFLCKTGGYFAGLIPCGEQGSRFRPSAISLDVAYQAAIYDTRHITDNQPPFTLPAVVNGRYSTVHHAGFVTLGVRF